ncbi:hypothetical protein NDU88_000644 [Pleurodeles waltl]|uniref:Uncharacterized protein n=1 Tax=Pleurodeles waltl TaxID=8319 RepID=A0AAV7V6Z5_PLEWA|nr:hypothetical protein NDU88_000644 [Pleurodeles waltl]
MSEYLRRSKMERISSFTEIKELIQDLVANDTTLDPGEIINKLCSTVTTLDEDLEHSAQVEECAIKLWNWGMTKRIGSVINNEERAKLRHVACKLLCKFEGAELTEATLRRQILMTMKTGKGWVDLGKPSIADEFLQIAVNIIL